MSISIYELTVPAMTRGLQNLAAVLNKAKAHAEATKYDANVLLAARLFPDMFPLTRQVQLTTDFAKGVVARLAGLEVPKWDDTETSFEELQARIQKALAYLGTFREAQFAGAEHRPIELKTPAGTFNFTGQSYLLNWALPNFYFHVTTAYNLLRHNGVPIGKLDFLGKE